MPTDNSAEKGEDALVGRFRRGDLRAFARIVRRFQDGVYTYCLRTLSSPRTAFEQAGAVFVDLQRDLLARGAVEPLEARVFRLAVERCSRFGVETIAFQESGAPRYARRPATPTDREPAPSAALSGDRRPQPRDHLQELLSAMSEEHRQVLLLKDILGLDNHTIVAVLGITPAAMRTRLHHGRFELVRALARSGLSGEAHPEKG